MALSSPALASTFQAPARPSAITVASNGMQAASGQVDEDASTIARSGPDISAMVDLEIQRDTFVALGTVIRVSDQMLGSVLDILA
jgi:hypothetical protein